MTQNSVERRVLEVRGSIREHLFLEIDEDGRIQKDHREFDEFIKGNFSL